jgi:protease-4
MALSEDSSPPTAGGLSLIWRVLLWIGLPLLIGVWLAASLVPQPAVGVIKLTTDIWSGSADFVMKQIDEARADPRVRAIVLQMDSPGGEVPATQVLYLELLNLRRDMPLVGSIDSIAASGGYYTVIASDPIYAKPSSTIGNIGVWGFIPSEIGVNDVILASGPFKLTASNRDEFLREIDAIKQEFIAAVVAQRSERLAISESDITQGLAYSGREALRLGLIDHIGGLSEAIDAAAQQAGIANYDVIDLAQRVIDKQPTPVPLLFEPWVGAADPATGRRALPPGVYLLYDLRLRGAP